MNTTNKWLITLAVLLPTLLEVIDTSVVNVSLDHIRGSLSAGLDESTWTITAYLVSNAIIIPLTGWLSRIFGRKRYLIASVVLFTVSSFMCGSAGSLTALVLFRILQGIGGGALQPISQSILLETFPPSQYGMAMAMFGVGIMFGPIVGPVMGGWITDNWSWRWIFYINIPIGIISCFMLMRYIKDPPYLKRIGLGAKVDYWGLALIVVGIGCLQVIMDKGQREDWFSSSLIVRLAIISAVSLIAFVFIELKKKDPILNLRELKNVSFASANLIQFTAFFTLFGSIVLLPLYLQTLMGYTSFLAGFVLAPGGVATLFVMPMVGKMMTKTNPKWILFFGLLINAYSMFTMTRFNLNIDMDMAIWSRVILGVGMGMTFVPLTSLAFRTIPKEDMANASSIYSLLRNIAGSFGIATMTTLLARRAQFHQFHYAENLTPYDPHYQMAIYKATSALTAKAGANAPMAAKGLIYQQLMKQSTLNAFIDSFHVACIIILIVAPLVFFLKNSNPTEKNIMAH